MKTNTRQQLTLALNSAATELQKLGKTDVADVVLKAADSLSPDPDEEEPADVSPSAGRLVDLSVLYKVLDLSASTGKDVTEAMRMAVRFQAAFIADVDQYLVPLFALHGFKTYPRLWERAKRPAKTLERFQERSRLVSEIIAKLKTKPALFKSTFADSRVMTGARQFAEAAIMTDPAEAMKGLAAIRPMEDVRIRNVAKKAALAFGVEIAVFDDMLIDVAAAKDQGATIRAVDAQLATTAPGTDLAIELQARRTEAAKNIVLLSDGAANPSIVMSAAISEAAAKTDGYQTKTGASLPGGMNPQQEDAMMVRGKGLIAAGAGSGKTRVLAAKVVYHIKELGLSPANVVATSFSKKSAYELISRIKKFGGAGILEGAGGMDGFGTTHSVAMRLLARSGQHLNLLPTSTPKLIVRVAKAQVTLAAMGDTFEPDALENFFQDSDPNRPKTKMVVTTSVNKEALDAYFAAVTSARQILRNNPFAQDFLTKFERFKTTPSNMSDKQRAVFDRLMRQAGVSYVDPAKAPPPAAPVTAVAVTAMATPFTTSAAPALLSAGDGDGPDDVPDDGEEEDDKDVASRIKRDLKRWETQAANQWFNMGVGKDGWRIIEDKRKKGVFREPSPGEIMRKIGLWVNSLVTPGVAFHKAKAANDKVSMMYAAAYGAYMWLKGNDPSLVGRLDFDDLLVASSRALIKNPDLHAETTSRFKCVLVDEAQDLNASQHLLFGLISGYYDPATQKPNLDGKMTADTYTLIGDDKQAIYEFRGANPDIYIDLAQEFSTKYLDMNWRSGSSIVDAANTLMAHNKKQIQMTCKSNPEEKGTGSIRGIVVKDHEAGAEFVAQRIKDLTTGDGAPNGVKDFGIACRTNAEMSAFVMSLMKRGIPFRTKADPLKDPAVTGILNWLRLVAVDLNDTAAVNKIVKEAHYTPGFGLDAVFQQGLQQQAGRGNYLKFLQDGGWRSIYGGQQAYRNKNVKDYLDALMSVVELQGVTDPTLILQEIMGLKGVAFSGKPQPTVERAIMALVMNNPEELADLVAASPNGEVTEEAVRTAVQARIAPLTSMVGSFQSIGEALEYVAKMERANSKNRKKLAPDKANQADTAYEEPAVVIDTIHGWKGLEVPNLFVPMADGVFPSSFAKEDPDPRQMESERRLAYVAITRGEDSVTIICPGVNHRGQESGPSSFLSEACIPIDGPPPDAAGLPVSGSFDSFVDPTIPF